MGNLSTLNITFLIVILILLVFIVSMIFTKFNKKKELDDLFIVVDMPKEKTKFFGNSMNRIKVPRGQKYRANIYPEDLIVIRDKQIIVGNPKQRRIIERSDSNDDVTFIIKKGTQPPTIKA